MTVRQILELDPEYWELGEFGLDNDHIYEQINTQQSILKLYEETV